MNTDKRLAVHSSVTNGGKAIVYGCAAVGDGDGLAAGDAVGLALSDIAQVIDASSPAPIAYSRPAAVVAYTVPSLPIATDERPKLPCACVQWVHSATPESP